MVIGIKGELENEREVRVLGGVNHGGVEKEEGEKGKNIRGGIVGRHLRTKAEAYEYLADLSQYPSLANWVVGEAREDEARRLRRKGKSKRKEPESQVVGDGDGRCVLGRIEVLAPENRVAQMGVGEGAQGSNPLREDAAFKSEDAQIQQQKMAESGLCSAYIGKDTVLETETAVARQYYVDDTVKGDNGNTSSFKERTEPTNHGNVQEESGSIVHRCFSCAEEVEATVDAMTEDVIDLSEQGEQVENDTDLEGTILLEAERKDIIPVKLHGLQIEKDADLEGTVSLEALPRVRKDIIPLNLTRPLRYFDQQDSSSGEDDYCHLGKKQQKQKVCCICGCPGHDWKKCNKVNKCLFCGKTGHLAKDCPREDIVWEQTSNFCLKCANSGHGIFSCTNDYPADDLEKIQCHVCKAFGHLCCANFGNEGPKSLSCYNCGESDHLGSECKKVQANRMKPHNSKKKHKKLQEKKRPPAVLVHPSSGERGHSAQECDEKAKEVSRPKEASAPTLAPILHVPRLANLPPPMHHVPWLNLPYQFGYSHQNHGPRFDPPYMHDIGSQNYIPRWFNPPQSVGYGAQGFVPRFASPQGQSQGRGSNYYPLQQRQFFGPNRPFG